MFRNQHGFTLIEMMVVLLVISILLIVTIPNVTKHNSTINETGCEAFKQMVESQIQAYEIDKKTKPAAINDLVSAGYLKEGQSSCPNGKSISITAQGEVAVAP